MNMGSQVPSFLGSSGEDPGNEVGSKVETPWLEVEVTALTLGSPPLPEQVQSLPRHNRVLDLERG